jgi:TctA family transporter
MMEALSAMASVMGDPYLLGLITGTTILGIIIGVLPGLGATTGAALLLPFTLTMTRSTPSPFWRRFTSRPHSPDRSPPS